MNAPTVSVLIVNWNQGDLLRLAVESILQQTWRDLELVVVDNGSTDGSAARLRDTLHDPRVRFEMLPGNLGVGAGINHGATLCRGKYIALMDSDDISHPRRLELQVAALEAQPGLTGIGCDAQLIDEQGVVCGEQILFHTPEEIRGYAPYGMPLHHPSLVYRREVLERWQYREDFVIASDHDFISRAVEGGDRFAALPLMLYHYRRHGGSITMSRVAAAHASVAIVRTCAARRSAGRAENIPELRAIYDRTAEGTLPLWRMYLLLAAINRRDGCPVLACLHSALAVRARPGLRTSASYAWSLLLAVLREPRGLAVAASGLVRGPFWLLLKGKGFPRFPRY